MSVMLSHRSAAFSIVGCRPNQEDAYLVKPRLYVVCDGLGGHADGEIASALACATLARAWDRAPDIRTAAELRPALEYALTEAHQVIRRENRSAKYPMATTVVALALACDQPAGVVAWAGDSRGYRLRKNKLEALTKDHVALGADQEGVMRPLIQHALGHWDGTPEFREFDVMSGDVFLLCTDGMLVATDDVLEGVLDTANTPRAACRRLQVIAEAYPNDNTTAIVVKVHERTAAKTRTLSMSFLP